MDQQIEMIKPTIGIAFRIWWWMFWRKFLIVFLVGGVTLNFVASFVNDGERFLKRIAIYLLFWI